MTDHPQVTITHPRYGPTDVDEGLAPLLTILWECGIDTELSCQSSRQAGDSRPTVWILFPDHDNAESFLNMAVTEFSDEEWSLYQRARGDYYQPDDWQYRTRAVDLNVAEEFEPLTEDPNGPVAVHETPTEAGPWLVFEVSVRFPVEDLPAVHAAAVAFRKAGDEIDKAVTVVELPEAAPRP